LFGCAFSLIFFPHVMSFRRHGLCYSQFFSGHFTALFIRASTFWNLYSSGIYHFPAAPTIRRTPPPRPSSWILNGPLRKTVPIPSYGSPPRSAKLSVLFVISMHLLLLLTSVCGLLSFSLFLLLFLSPCTRKLQP